MKWSDVTKPLLRMDSSANASCGRSVQLHKGEEVPMGEEHSEVLATRNVAEYNQAVTIDMDFKSRILSVCTKEMMHEV